MTDYFAVEVGYGELGNVAAEFPSLSYSAPLTIPRLDPVDLPLSGGVIGVAVARPTPPELEPSTYSLAARFSVPLAKKFSALWHVTLERAEFKASGSTSVLVAPDTTFGSFTSELVPYADPGDETGFSYGFGFGWQFGEHFSAEISYARKDLRVLEFDSIGLRLVGWL